MTMMNRTGTLLVLLALAMPLVAADEPKPDYSVDAMFRFSHDFVEHRSAIMDFDLDNLGAVDIYKYGVHTRLRYLPLLAPMAGTRLADVATVPNAFALTNTRIARSMPYLPDDASLSREATRELKRALRLVDQARIEVTEQ
jgi:hypothetical protein